MSSPPPGWYDDGHGAQRWWDGDAWTEHTHEAAPVLTRMEPQGTDAAAEPVRPASRLWIVWVVLAVVVVAIIVSLAILIPTAMTAFSHRGAVTGGSADERAAARAVQTYDDAWQQADCDLLAQATTEDLRQRNGLDDCTTFQEDAQTFNESNQDYVVSITSIERVDDDEIHVMTTETYDTLVDDDGNPLDSPQPMTDLYDYTVVEDDGAWLIDATDVPDAQ